VTISRIQSFFNWTQDHSRKGNRDTLSKKRGNTHSALWVLWKMMEGGGTESRLCIWKEITHTPLHYCMLSVAVFVTLSLASLEKAKCDPFLRMKRSKRGGGGQKRFRREVELFLEIDKDNFPCHSWAPSPFLAHNGVAAQKCRPALKRMPRVHLGQTWIHQRGRGIACDLKSNVTSDFESNVNESFGN